MAQLGEQRQLAAIMFTDIVGYTALMSESESTALRILKHSRRSLRRLARRYRGRWLESVGDGNLVKFHSATDAVGCALALQNSLRGDSDLQLRIGIHVGDIIEAGGHLYGDGVNVASRIHGLADAGGIAVSETVYDAVRNKSGISVRKLGVKTVKGLDHPIQVYALEGDSVDTPSLGLIDLPDARRSFVFVAAIALIVVAVLATGLHDRLGEPRADELSVAVLPFKNLSEDSGNAYFSEGISEEILNGLSRVKGLRIVGRTTSSAFREAAGDIRAIGKNLNAAHVVDGSVRKAGNRVRISAQLVDTDNGYQLWAETFDAEVDDIFEVQASISRAIVEALRVELMPEELADIGLVGTSDPRAYDLYLQARNELRKASTVAEVDEALSLLEDALRRDPTFTEAEATQCEALVRKYGFTRDNALIEPAIAKCNRAESRDPRSPLVQIAMGNLYETTGRADFAVEAYRRALSLDDTLDNAHRGLGNAFATMGRMEAAESAYLRAIELGPGNARNYSDYGVSLYQAGRMRDAESMVREVVRLKPEDALAYSNLGGLLYYQARFDEASEMFEKSIEINPNANAYSNAGTNMFFAGDYEKAVDMFRRAVALRPDDFRLYGNLADACRFSPECRDEADLYARTIELADQRLKVQPEDANALALKAQYLVHMGHGEESERLMDRAIELAPQNMEVLVSAAILWSQLKDAERVRTYVKRAQEAGYPEGILRKHPDIHMAESQTGPLAGKGGYQ